MKVFIIAALSADGFIGQDSSQSSLNWTRKEDTRFFVQRTKQAGTMVVGSTTFKTFNKALPERRIIVYTNHPEEITVQGVESTDLEPKELAKKLEAEGVKELAIAGGSTIYKMFMDSGLVDELYLTIEPVLFGQGIPLFNGPLTVQMSLLDITKLNEDTTLLHYAVNK